MEPQPQPRTKETNAKMLAAFLELMKSHVELFIDQQLFDFIKEAADEMIDKALRYDSAAALNRNYNTERSSLMALQADALVSLHKFIQANVQIREQRKKVEKEDERTQALSKLFE